MIIGAALTSAVFYFVNKSRENDQKENLADILALVKQGQDKNSQANETINRPGSTMALHAALSIVLTGNDDVYYYRNTDCSKIEKTNFTMINAILKSEKDNIKTEDLMILIKPTQDASFKNSVDLLDAISSAGIPAGHFAEVELSEKEKYCLQNYKKN